MNNTTVIMHLSLFLNNLKHSKWNYYYVTIRKMNSMKIISEHKLCYAISLHVPFPKDFTLCARCSYEWKYTIQQAVIV